MALSVDGPDALAASSLEAAAELAAARGAPAAAAELYELAAALTPDDPALARARRFPAARSHRLAGDIERASAILDQLLTALPHGVERADVLFELASTLKADSQITIDLLNEALEDAADDNVRLARILGYRGWIRVFQTDIRAALADVRRALEKAELVGDPALIAVTIGHVATVEGRAGEFTQGLLERGVEIEEGLGLVLEYGESPSVSLSRRLVGFGELDRARAILETLAAKAVARGDEVLRGQIAGSLGRLEWFAGNWQLALEHLDVAYEVQEQTLSRHQGGVDSRLRALTEADIGLVEQARKSAKEALATSEAVSDREWTILTLGVLGRIELAIGNLEAAVSYLRELPGELLSTGYNDPTAPLWGDAIEALISTGELELAHASISNDSRRTRGGSGAPGRSRRLRAVADLPSLLRATLRPRSKRSRDPWPSSTDPRIPSSAAGASLRSAPRADGRSRSGPPGTRSSRR